MSEIRLGAGDAVSRLLQTIAKEVGITEIRWIGVGDRDVRNVLTELYNANLVRISLWHGVADLLAMPEWKTLPESIQAQAAAVILRARACIELGEKKIT